MKQDHSRAFKISARRLAAILALLLIAAGVTAAQGPPAGAGPPGVRDPKSETNIQADREATLRTAEVVPAATQMNQQRLAAAIEQTKQDFKRIQLIRNDIVDNLVAKKPLDYKLIAKQAGEVNERALRLKSFLMPPVADAKNADAEKDSKKQAVEYDADALKGALVKLCNTVFSFTGNQMFQDPGTVDAQKATKAGGDLLSIIELSNNIKSNAERLGKSPR
ncbi:MAG TPA: hypothetical protein VLJ61_08960 [Pyrinomonadaceae bacterium]|nr:hypothetical protein [Pyrinomonadaceae bacterium]